MPRRPPVEQHFYSVGDDDKRHALRQILKRGLTQAFVFVNSKLGCAWLARSLERGGLRTTALHGDKSQDERLKALDTFKKGEVDLLVCTDVAARGPGHQGRAGGVQLRHSLQRRKTTSTASGAPAAPAPLAWLSALFRQQRWPAGG